MADITTITYFTGTKKLKPIEYRLIKKKTAQSWVPWRNRFEYFIETDLCHIGPIDRADAYEMAAMGQFVLKDYTNE